MFWFDKDMERVMLAKKKEVLTQIEDAKKRVLEELYCVKREVHTDFCEMLADYNRIDFALKKLVADLKQEVKDCVDSYKNILAEQIISFNQQIDTKINVFEQYVNESIATLENALAELETMQNTVNGLIARVEELVNGCASTEDLEQLRQEFETAIANIDLSAFKEEILSQVVQSDWNEADETSKAHVLNRTHYGTIVETVSTGIVTYADGEKVSDPNMTSLPIVFVVPLAVDINERSSVNITVREGDNIVFNERYQAVVKPFVHVTSALEPESTTMYMGKYTAYNDVLVWGDTGTVGAWYEGEKLQEKVAVLYKIGSALYLTLPLGQYNRYILSYEISVDLVNVEKELPPFFLAQNSANGYHLALVDNKMQWVKPAVSNYSRLIIDAIVNGDIPTSVYKYSSYYYSVNVENFEGFNVGETYIITMEGRTERATCKKANTLSGGYIEVDYDNGKITFDIHESKAAIYITNPSTSCFIKLERLSVKEYEGILSPETLCENPVDFSYPVVRNGFFEWNNSPFVISSTGKIFQITVSDDGTLSTTPVTT